MLKEGELKVNEICYSVGFSSPRVISLSASMNNLEYYLKNLIKNNEKTNKNNLDNGNEYILVAITSDFIFAICDL